MATGRPRTRAGRWASKAGIALSLLLLLAGAAEIAGLVYLNTHGSSMLLFMIA